MCAGCNPAAQSPGRADADRSELEFLVSSCSARVDPGLRVSGQVVPSVVSAAVPTMIQLT